MITQGFGLMKYILVFHPFGVAQRSKSVPNGFVTGGFPKERNTDCIPTEENALWILITSEGSSIW
jgi:hypothetical protein